LAAFAISEGMVFGGVVWVCPARAGFTGI